MRRSLFGMEAIEFQSKDFVTGAAKIIEEWRTSKKYDDGSSFAQALSGLISDKTGISTIVNIAPYPFPNAFVEIPQLDKNNPIINNMIRSGHTNNDLRKLNKIIGDTFTGILDFEKGRVYGDFTKIVVPVFLTAGLMDDKDFDGEEIAGIVSHELGHVWSYFEALRDIVNANVAAQTVAARLLGMNTPQERLKLVHECADALETPAKDLETIVNETNKEVIYTHIVSTTLRSRRNVEGDDTYSYRAFEFASDQFAVRMGAGLNLASALAKIERKSFLNMTYRSWPAHIIFQTLDIALHVGLMFSGPLTAILTTINLLVARPLDKIYDDPKHRLERIRREMINELKQDMPKELRASLVRDLAKIEDLCSKMSPKTDWLEAIWKYMIPAGRTSEAKMAFQQNIERLANNELFVSASKLEGI